MMIQWDPWNGSFSAYPNIKLEIDEPQIAKDAAITALASPEALSMHIGNYDIAVTIKNIGNDALTSAAIYWSIDGVTQSPVNWSGALAKDQTANVVLATDYAFNEIRSYNITAEVRAAGDQVPGNNRITRTLEFWRGFDAPYVDGLENVVALDDWGNVQLTNNIPYLEFIMGSASPWVLRRNPNTYFYHARSGIYYATLQASQNNILYLPVVIDETGDYRFSVWALNECNYDTYDPSDATVALLWNTTPTDADMQIVTGATTIPATGTVTGQPADYTEVAGTFTVTTPGVYYMGIMGYGGTHSLAIDDIALVKVGQAAVHFAVNSDEVPVAGADIAVTVGAETQTLTTNAAGTASIALPAGASYAYTVSCAGFAGASGTVTLAAGATEHFENVALTADPCGAPANLTYTLNGNDITLNWTEADGSATGTPTFPFTIYQGQWDEWGGWWFNTYNPPARNVYGYSYTFQNLGTGRHGFFVTKACHAGELPDPTAFNEETYDFADVSLSGIVTVSFYSLDEGWTAVPGATVTLDGTTTRVTDAEGYTTFVLPLDANEHTYVMSKLGYETVNGSFVKTDWDTWPAQNIHLLKAKQPVTFTVVDDNGSAINNASIDINDGVITTNAEGVASINLDNGTYGYSASATGFAPASGQVVVDNAPVAVPVALEPMNYSAYFTVLDVNGDPVSGATVAITSPAESATSVVTDAQGRVSIELSNGTYGFTVTKTGFDVYTNSFTIDNDHVAVTVALVSSFRAVTFTVTDAATGSAINGATVTINGGSLAEAVVVYTNLAGQAVANLENGDYSYAVSYYCYDTKASDFTVSGTSALNVQLSKSTPAVTFTVTSGSEPVAGAAVIIDSNNEGTTDANGQLTVALEACGFYNVVVNKTGYQMWSNSSLQVYGEPTQAVAVDLVAINYTVTFNVTNGSAAPLANASVVISKGGAEVTTVTTDAAGAATASLPNGGYSYVASLAGYPDATGGFTVENGAATVGITMNMLTYAVNFTVVDGGSAPIAGASIAIASQTLTTNAAGQATISLPNASYPYSVSKTGFESASGTVTVNSAVREVTVTLEPTLYNVSFAVADASGNAVENAVVSISGQELYTDAEGLATTQLPNGTYTYTVAADGYVNAAGEAVVLNADKDVAVTLQFIPYDVTFTVTDGDTDALVAGATVAIRGADAGTTNSSGVLTVQRTNGSYTYTVSKLGYVANSGSFTVADAATSVSVELTPATYEVVFNVTSGGNALAGATIEIASRTLTTNEAGVASTELKNAVYPYTVSMAGYQSRNGSVTVDNASPAVQNVSLNPVPYTVTFNVTDEDNAPLAGANVQVTGNGVSSTLTTTSAGVAEIDLPNGTYSYSASKLGYPTVSAGFTVAGAAQSIDVQLLPDMQQVTFTVTSDSSAPVEGATVSVDGKTATTNASGVATVSLAIGTYEYTVAKAGFSTATGSVEVLEEAVAVDVTLTQTAFAVSFRVKDAEGQDMSGVAIAINGQTLSTGQYGTAYILLENGTYAYTVSKANYNTIEGEVTVAGAAQEINLQMAISLYAVTFIVSEDGAPIAGAQVTVGAQSAATDAQGVAVVELPNGTHSYAISKLGYDTYSGNVTVAGAATTVNVDLSGSVYDVTFSVTHNSAPVAGAAVVINGQTLPTNSMGQASVQLGNGTYAYTVTKAGFDTVSGEATVANAAQTVEVALTATLYTVTFNVKYNGEAIQGAEVAIEGQTLTTDAAGQASLQLVNGTYDYTVEAQGYNAYQGQVTVNSGAATANVNLVGTLYDVTFTVVANGSPLEGALVSVGGQTLTTDAAGAAVAQLSNGTYNYTVSKSGYNAVANTVTVANGPEAVAVSMVATQYAVSFVVTSAGQPVEGASVEIASQTLTTNAAGQANLQLVNGTYAYTVSKAGFDGQSGTVVVDGAAQSVTVDMSATLYAVTFTVTDGVAPLQGAAVTINGVVYNTDADGVATMSLPNGSYPYTVSLQGFDAANGTVVVDNAPATEQVLMGQSRYTVTFTVTAGGNAAAGATIAIAGQTLTTNAAGSAAAQLYNGTYDYTVSLAGYNTQSGSLVVAFAEQTVQVALVATLYDVTLTVTDGADALEGAAVAINGRTLYTNELGAVALQLANGSYDYTVDLAGYDQAAGTVVVDNAPVAETVTLTATLYTVTFNVTDAAGNALAGASIAVAGQTLTTDASGMVTIDLPNGTYAYTVNVGEYDEYASNVTVANAAVTVVVPLGATLYDVTFTVANEFGMVLEGATIAINGQTLTTAAAGSAVIALANGSYDYTVTMAGYDAQTGTVVVENAAQAVTVNISTTLYTVTFNVAAGDVAIEGATIAVAAVGQTLTTDAAGVATVELASGSYDYTVTKLGYDVVSGNVNVVYGDMTVDVAMAATLYDVTFTVTDGAAALEGATVAIAGQTLTTDAAGAAAIALANGSYPYTVTMAGYQAAAGTVVVENAAQAVEVALEGSAYAVTFNVSDGAAAIAGAEIAIAGQTLVSNSVGQASVELPNGTYEYTVAALGYDIATGTVAVANAPATANVALVATLYAVTFNVTDGAAALAGASIAIAGQTLTTDAAGAAAIELANGSYDYAVTLAGYDLFTGDVTVDFGATTVDVEMTESLYVVSFNVTSGTAAVAGASIAIAGQTLTTNAAGVASVQLTNGTYAYTVTKSGFFAHEGEVTVANAPATVAVALESSLFAVTFNVTDGANAVSGASIAIAGQTLTTNASGSASIQLENGTYPYTVVKAGFDAYNGSVTVANAPATANVALQATLHAVAFNVTDGAEAVAGASIAIAGQTLVTNASGAASIQLANGTYTYTVTKVGFDAYNGSVTVNNAAATANVTLAATLYAVTFNVTDGAAAIGTATVAINGQTLITNAQGTATAQLANGSYDYTVTKAGYTAASGSVTVNNAAQTVDVAMQATAYTVTFHATGAQGQPLAEVEIDVEGNILTTDAAGTASVELPNGTYSYVATKDGLTAEGTFTVANAAVDVDVTLGVVGVEEFVASISLYPNPATSVVTITRADASLATVEVYNHAGALVLTLESDQLQQTVDVSSLVPGAYLLRVASDAGSQTMRFVKF